MPSTATPTPTYVAVTDPGTKHWHLGSLERAEVCYCGTRLMTPADTRKFALKVPAAERNYQVDTALDCIDCGACKRNREYRYATGLETRPATTTTTTSRRQARQAPVPAPENAAAAAEARMGESELAANTRRRRPQHAATVTPAEAAELANGAAEAAADHAAPPSRRRRPSKADRAHAAAQRDAERRTALAESADATVAAIEAAVAQVTGEPPLQAALNAAAPAWNRAVRGWKADALMDSGLATSRADARAQLADMGE